MLPEKPSAPSAGERTTRDAAPRWRVKEHGDDLITYWKTKPRGSNEYAAAEIIEELERSLAESRANADDWMRRYGSTQGHGTVSFERVTAALHACEGLDTVDLAKNNRGWLSEVIHDAARVEADLAAVTRDRDGLLVHQANLVGKIAALSARPAARLTDAELLDITNRIFESVSPTQTLREWLQTRCIESASRCKGVLVAKVAKLRGLPKNWDSYGADAMPEETVQLATGLAMLLDNDEWSVVPCADGPSIWFTRNGEDEIIEVRTHRDEASPPDRGTDDEHLGK